LLMGLYFIVALTMAMIPSTFHDSLNYHLAGPQYWVLNGGLQKSPDHIIYLFSSYFEMLFIWPMVLLDHGTTTDLIGDFCNPPLSTQYCGPAR